MLTVGETVTNFVDSEIASIFYYELFAQGASLVPRNLCFVAPAGLAEYANSRNRSRVGQRCQSTLEGHQNARDSA